MTCRLEVHLLTRDLAAELDALKEEVRRLAESMKSQALPPFAQAKHLRDMTDQSGTSGFVQHAGYYAAGERGYMWEYTPVAAETLLALDDEAVARVLAALGNKQRLAILKAILKQPATAAELVERLDMGTTGQVYHHLKALQTTGLITQEERGIYAFRGPRVSGLLLMLAAAQNVLSAESAKEA